MPPEWIEQLLYSIEVFDASHGYLIEVMARVADLDIAHATFEAARRKHPHAHIELRMGDHIIESTW